MLANGVKITIHPIKLNSSNQTKKKNEPSLLTGRKYRTYFIITGSDKLDYVVQGRKTVGSPLHVL